MKRLSQSSRVLVGALMLSTTLPGAARAQRIDYGSLQELFGEPVTTSATGKPQRASESPATMQIITADEIRKSGAFTIPQILERVAGLDIVTSNITQQSIGVRGFAKPQATQTLIMINGRPLFTEDLFEVEWNALAIQVQDIQQIEVVKGPASALFGFNAFRGVVNIITKDPLQSPVNTATIAAGNYDYFKFSASKTIPFSPSLAARISAAYQESDQFKAKQLPFDYPTTLPIDTALNGRKAKHRSVSGDIVWAINDKSSLRVESGWVNADHSSQWTTFSNVYSRQDAWSMRAAYSLDSDLGLINISGYVNQVDLQWTPNYSGVPVDSYSEAIETRAEDLIKIGTDHTIRLSAEYRRGTGGGGNNKVTDVFGINGARFIQETIALGGMWDWALSPTVSLTNSLRVDFGKQWREGTIFPDVARFRQNSDYDRSMTPLSFNSYLTWRPTDDDTLRLTVGGAPQLTPACESACQTGGGGVYYIGSPGLPLARITAYEVAYDRNLDAIGGLFRAALWYQDIRHSKGFATLPAANAGVLLFPVVDGGNSKAIGTELELHGSASNGVYWSVDYAYVDINDDPTMVLFQGALAVNHPMEWEKTTSKHKFGGRIGVQQGPWEAEIGGKHYSGRYGFAGGTSIPIRVPSYTNVQGRVAYKLSDSLTLALTGNNLVDNHHVETNGVRIGTRYALSVTAQF